MSMEYAEKFFPQTHIIVVPLPLDLTFSTVINILRLRLSSLGQNQMHLNALSHQIDSVSKREKKTQNISVIM